MNNDNMHKYKLWQLKRLDICYLGLFFNSKKNTIYLNADTLLHIISYLDIPNILNLLRVNKIFYGLCRSNYIWGPRLFSKKDDPSETMMQLIYKNNESHFLNYFYFKHYFGINYRLDGNPNNYNYFDMFKNIVTLAADLRAPYYHSEIISHFRPMYNKMVEDGYRYEEFIYTVKAVSELPKYNENEYIWKYENITDDCELLLILKRYKADKIKFQKIIRPFKVPVDIIKKKKIIMFAETVQRLFMIRDYVK